MPYIALRHPSFVGRRNDRFWPKAAHRGRPQWCAIIVGEGLSREAGHAGRFAGSAGERRRAAPIACGALWLFLLASGEAQKA